jgi:hypothetical protein
MSALEEPVAALLAGPLLKVSSWPLLLQARLCDLRPRFLDKGRTGSGCRAIARNGRVLLCGDRALSELAGREVWLRLQTWHRSHLPGDVPEPYGVVVWVRGAERLTSSKSRPLIYATRLVSAAEAEGDLRLDVGGRFVLKFQSGG